MNTRRSFFKRIAQAVAVVALAPQIAFRTAPPKPQLTPQPPKLTEYWTQESCHSRCFDEGYIQAMGMLLTNASFTQMTAEHFEQQLAREEEFGKWIHERRGCNS